MHYSSQVQPFTHSDRFQNLLTGTGLNPTQSTPKKKIPTQLPDYRKMTEIITNKNQAHFLGTTFLGDSLIRVPSRSCITHTANLKEER